MGPATGVIQCKACLSVVTQLWELTVNWTHVAQRRITPGEVTAAGIMLCGIEMPVDVLKDWVILHAVVDAAPGGGPHGRAPSQDFFLLSQRHRQHATETERDAAQEACRDLWAEEEEEVEGGGSGSASPGLAAAVAAAQADYLRAYIAQIPTAVDAENAAPLPPPLPQRACYDKHPQCQHWAAKGECTANPTYMVGTPETGWCRRACEHCMVPETNHLAALTGEQLGCFS